MTDGWRYGHAMFTVCCFTFVAAVTEARGAYFYWDIQNRLIAVHSHTSPDKRAGQHNNDRQEVLPSETLMHISNAYYAAACSHMWKC